jgi:hypothetical protein
MSFQIVTGTLLAEASYEERDDLEGGAKRQSSTRVPVAQCSLRAYTQTCSVENDHFSEQGPLATKKHGVERCSDERSVLGRSRDATVLIRSFS